MFGVLQNRGSAGQGRIGVDEVQRAVHCAAYFATVAVLVFCVALGAFALDETVGQEHTLFGVVKLFNGFGADQVVGFQVTVNRLCQLMVFRAVGAVPVVKRNMKAVQIRLASRSDIGHKLLRCDARLLGGNHDGRAVGIIGTDKIHLVAQHALRAHPDIGLDVFHDVANVEIAVGIGQGGGNKQTALGHGEQLR